MGGGLKIDLLVLGYFIFFGFFIGSQWFHPNCSSSTVGDLEGHFFTSWLLRNQLSEYGQIYPVNIEHSTLGYYLFSYSPFTFVLPSLLSFLEARTSFLFFHVLFYSLSGFFLYLFLRLNKGELFSSLFFGTLLLCSLFINQQFTVYGSYHTMAIIPFLLLTIIFLQLTLKKASKRNVSLLVLFSSITCLIHFVAAIVTALLVVITLLAKKKYKILSFCLLGFAVTSFYYVPLVFQSLALPSESSGVDLEPLEFTLRSLFTPNLIVSTEKTYFLDTLYGPFYFIAFIASLLFTFTKIEKGSLAIRFKPKIIEQVLLFFTLSIFILMFLPTLFGAFRSTVPLDRIPFFFELSFFLFFAYTFSKIEFKDEFLLVGLFLLFVSEEYFAEVLGYAIFGLLVFNKLLSKRLSIVINRFNPGYIFAFIVVLFSVLPLTSIAHSSLSYPRVWCITFPQGMFINTSLSTADTVLYYSRDFFTFSTPYLTGASVVNTIGHTTLIKDIPDFGDPEWYDFVRRAGVSKFMYTTTNPVEKPSLIVNETGQGVATYYHRGLKVGLFFYDFAVENVPYSVNIVNPVNLEISLNEPLSEVSLRLFYHPWWRAYSGDQEFIVSQDDWFLKVSGLNGANSFNLRFDTTYFNLGSLISLASLAVLLFLLKSY